MRRHPSPGHQIPADPGPGHQIPADPGPGHQIPADPGPGHQLCGRLTRGRGGQRSVLLAQPAIALVVGGAPS